MAITWTKQHMKVFSPLDAFLDLVSRTDLEGASQTFASSSPIIWSSGLLVASTAPINTTNKLSGYALEGGHNGSGKSVKWCPAYPGIAAYMTLLASSAADYVLLAADLGTLFIMNTTANFPSTGANGWYFERTTTNAGVRLTSFGPTDQVPNNITQDKAVAGDTNARVIAEATNTVTAYV